MEFQSEKSTWVTKMSQFWFEGSGGGEAERRMVSMSERRRWSSWSAVS